jgi:hypothetical protein
MIHSELHRSSKFDDDNEEVGQLRKEVVKIYSKAYTNVSTHESEYPRRKYQIPQWSEQEGRS